MHQYTFIPALDDYVYNDIYVVTSMWDIVSMLLCTSCEFPIYWELCHKSKLSLNLYIRWNLKVAQKHHMN